MKVLITGGAGYIGSTVGSACLDAGHDVVILDDLSAGRREFTEGRPFVEGDVGDRGLLDQIFSGAVFPGHAIDAVIHCAAKIVVPESVADPLGYYESNVTKSLILFAAMADHQVPRLVFSSSASVYAPTDDFLVTEDSALGPQSPYARTKAMMEWAMEDVARTGAFKALALRYFNPLGADPQLRTGQQIPHPTHVLGKIMSADQAGETFTITGADWPTPDGSGLRDFIHVWDLALAHVQALEKLDEVCAESPFTAINLGTGRPNTVRNLVAAYEQVVSHSLDVQTGPPRPGDVAGVYAAVDTARDRLGWKSQFTVEDAVRDALRWGEIRPQRLGE